MTQVPTAETTPPAPEVELTPGTGEQQMRGEAAALPPAFAPWSEHAASGSALQASSVTSNTDTDVEQQVGGPCGSWADAWTRLLRLSRDRGVPVLLCHLHFQDHGLHECCTLLQSYLVLIILYLTQHSNQALLTALQLRHGFQFSTNF